MTDAATGSGREPLCSLTNVPPALMWSQRNATAAPSSLLVLRIDDGGGPIVDSTGVWTPQKCGLHKSVAVGPMMAKKTERGTLWDSKGQNSYEKRNAHK